MELEVTKKHLKFLNFLVRDGVLCHTFRGVRHRLATHVR